jgi:hypothetical protein
MDPKSGWETGVKNKRVIGWLGRVLKFYIIIGEVGIRRLILSVGKEMC